MGTVAVKNLAVGIQSGTTNVASASWAISSAVKHLKGYSVKWSYYAGKWYVGSDWREQTDRNALYTIPNIATAVKCYVKPVSTTHKKDNKDIAYFTGTAKTATYYVRYSPPVTPSAPSITVLSNGNIQLQVNNVDALAELVQFQLVNSKGQVYKTANVAVVAGSATLAIAVDKTDTYRARCRAVNNKSSGKKIPTAYSDWSEFAATTYTMIPATPQKFTAKFGANNTVFFSWGAVANATGYEIQYAAEAKEYLDGDQAKTVSVTGTSYNIRMSEAGKYYCRIRAKNSAGNSGWSSVVFVAYATAPDAPTAWNIVTTYAAEEDTVIPCYFSYNSADGAGMTECEIYMELGRRIDTTLVFTGLNTASPQYSFSGPEAFVTAEECARFIQAVKDGDQPVLNMSGYYIASAVDESFKWQVRVKGSAAAGWSEWSAVRSVFVYEVPSVYLSTNYDSYYDPTLHNYVVKSFPINHRWYASNTIALTVSGHIDIIAMEPYETIDWSGNIINVAEGQAVYSGDAAKTDYREVTSILNANDVILEDGIEYRVDMRMLMDTGIPVELSRTFVFKPNASDIILDASVTVNDDLTATIVPYAYSDDEDGDQIEAVVNVYRYNYDGTFTKVGDVQTSADPDAIPTLVDPHPALNEARYRLMLADPATGTIVYEDIPAVPVGYKSIVMQWAESYKSVYDANEDAVDGGIWSGLELRLPYNIDVSESGSKDVALVEYIGRGEPVGYYGTQKGYGASWSCAIKASDTETLDKLRHLQAYLGNVYVREPSGTGYWAHVDVNIGQTYASKIVQVSFAVTKVDGGAV